MAMRREQVAAALRYLQDKADLRGRLQRATSLDPQEQDLADIAVETGASLVPGVGPALAARDFERARRADDPVGMGMAAASAVPGGKLAGLLKRYDPTRLELDVYHGTPHRFPATEANPLGEFDASKIGTGEGAQAYGHGIYYAESPDVAESYRVGTTFAQKADRDIAEMLYSQKSGDADAAIASLKSEIKQLEKQGMPEGYKEQYDFALQKLQEFKKNPPKSGSLYKADLPDEMIDRMLDWDKPIKDQPEAVRKAIDRIESEFSMRKQPYKDQEGTGFWYGALTDTVGGQQNASKLLKEYGVPGIKYADAGSRGQGGSGTRNFVVFPGEEKKVRILERDGQKAPPQKIAQALEAAPRKAVKAEPQPFGVQGYLNDDLRRVKQNFFSQYGVEENKQFSKDYEVVELAKLKPSENINESKIQSLMKTMREEGNARDNPIPPIIVDSEGNILDGHHRYEAAKRLGAKYVPIVELFNKQNGPSFSE